MVEDRAGRPPSDLEALFAELPEPDARALRQLSERLDSEVPRFSAGAQSSLRSMVVRSNPVARPERLRLLVASYGGGGVSLIALAALWL